MEGQRYKAVGFLQAKEDSRSNATNPDKIIVTGGAEELNPLHADGYKQAGIDTRIDREGEHKPGNFQHLSTGADYFGEVIRAKRGMNLQGRKDPGVFHPPINRAKVDQEQESLTRTYV